MKKAVFLLAVSLSLLLCGCLQEVQPVPDDTEKELITVGFSQVGAESEWRVANTENIKATLSEENGYELIFDDARNEEENQKKAIRKFIQQGVDYIVFSPRVEKGWDSILQEAKEAGIPVIVIDRYIEAKDEDLYTAFVGSDFRKEGEKAVAWLEQLLEEQANRRFDTYSSYSRNNRVICTDRPDACAREGDKSASELDVGGAGRRRFHKGQGIRSNERNLKEDKRHRRRLLRERRRGVWGHRRDDGSRP